MKKTVTAIFVGGLLCVPLAFTSSATPGSSNKEQISHGEYLVKGVAGCPDCHTPMNEKGEFI
jgi:hypothetical protein